MPLYESQGLWREAIDLLEAEGFTLWKFKLMFSDHVSGRMLQADGIFTELLECRQMRSTNETCIIDKLRATGVTVRLEPGVC